MRKQPPFCAVLALTVSALLSSGTAQAGPLFSYEVIAQANDIIDGAKLGLIRNVALNNNGGIAFGADLAGSGRRGIFTPTTVLAQTGDVIGGKTLTNPHFPDINDDGTVVFGSAFTGPAGTGVFTPTSSVAVTGDTIAGKTFTQVLTDATINNAGTVAYEGRYSGGGRAYFSQDNLLYDDPPVFGRPSLNDSGTLAFESRDDFNRHVIRTQSGIAATLNDTIGGVRWFGVSVGGASATIGNSGEILWRGRGHAGGEQFNSVLFGRNRVVARTGTQIGNNWIAAIGRELAINASDDAAYNALVRQGATAGNAVFVENRKVAATGDTIDGKTVNSIADTVDLNDSGQVLFSATLDGVSSLILATPDLFPGALFNGDFQIEDLAGWAATGAGTAAEVTTVGSNVAAQLTAGSPVVLSQAIDTPNSPFDFSFDYLFESTSGTLDVYLNSLLIDSFSAPSSLATSFQTRSFTISDPNLLGLVNTPLEFRFDGNTGDSILLDNVAINNMSTSAVPEPSGLALVGIGALGLIGWRNRTSRRNRRENN